MSVATANARIVGMFLSAGVPEYCGALAGVEVYISSLGISKVRRVWQVDKGRVLERRTSFPLA